MTPAPNEKGILMVPIMPDWRAVTQLLGPRMSSLNVYAREWQLESRRVSGATNIYRVVLPEMDFQTEWYDNPIVAMDVAMGAIRR